MLFYKKLFYNLPNIITLLRIALIPLIGCYYQKHLYVTSALIFLLAAATDYIDGFIARKLRVVSSTGAKLDLLADKLIVIICLMLIVKLQHSYVITVPSIVIILREIIMYIIRQIMYIWNMEQVTAVSCLGKIKTVFQMSAIFMLILSSSNISKVYNIMGTIILQVSAILAVYSMSSYFSKLHTAMKNNSSESLKDN